MVELALLWHGEHQANFATLEEGQVRCLEEEGQAEGVAVEPRGAAEILDVDCDLAESRMREIMVAHGRRRGRVQLVS